MERPDILQDPRFSTREGRIANHEALIAVLGGVFAGRTREQWCRRLTDEDVPHAPMYDTAEALRDPQARHLQLEIEGNHPTRGPWRTVRSPVSFDGQRACDVTPPPLLGEHNAQIRAALASRNPSSRDPS